jgi:hypothetical protein
LAAAGYFPALDAAAAQEALGGGGAARKFSQLNFAEGLAADFEELEQGVVGDFDFAAVECGVERMHEFAAGVGDGKDALGTGFHC